MDQGEYSVCDICDSGYAEVDGACELDCGSGYAEVDGSCELDCGLGYTEVDGACEVEVESDCP